MSYPTDNCTRKVLKVSELLLNNGQIEGLPRNPRFIRNEKFEALKRSITDDPEFMQVREVIVIPYEGKYVAVGGNQRLRAVRELGWKEVPCKVLPGDTPPKKLRAYAVKDNNQFGEWDWDIANNEWDIDEWRDFGIDFFGFVEEEGEDERRTETEKLSKLEYTGMYFEPKEIPNLKLEQAVDLTKYKEKIRVIEASGLGEKEKEALKVFAYRFIKINFEAVACYYAFNASEEEKRVIERLRLVLVDGGINGFIEDDLLRIRQEVLEDAIEREEGNE